MSQPGELRLGSVQEPVCQPDEVVLRTEAVSICSTDVSYFRGHLSSSTWPLIPGHEYVGTVVDVGSRLADAVRPGERLCYWGQTDFGGMAEYRAIRPLLPGRPQDETTWFTDRGFTDADQAAAVVVPHDLPSGLATALEPLTSVLRSLLPNPPRPGDTCAVLGCGPSSLLAVQVLRRHLGVEVIVLDHNEQRLRTALRCGAKRGFDPVRQADEIRQFIGDTRGQAVDYVFDALPHVGPGAGAGIRDLAMGMLRPGGTYVVYGASALPQQISTWMILAKGLNLRATPFDVGVFAMARSAHVLEVAAGLVASGLVDARPLFTRTVDLHDEEGVVDAFARYGSGASMKTSMVTSRDEPPRTPGATGAGLRAPSADHLGPVVVGTDLLTPQT
ncbi:zinc-dependent alcohol dehydrogenase [Streptomyces sulfonofaciens]|nr:zinc-binding dehydrogenase [Streptomyces sulfonofaciens]